MDRRADRNACGLNPEKSASKQAVTMSWYPIALVVFAIAFVMVGAVTVYFSMRLTKRVRPSDLPSYRRAMRNMRYDEARDYIEPAGHADLAWLRSASLVLTGIALFGAALIFGPTILGTAPNSN